jgi:hypothetical protein
MRVFGPWSNQDDGEANGLVLCRDADPTPCRWAPSDPPGARGPRSRRAGAWGLEGVGMQMQDSCVVQVGETVPTAGADG